MAVIRSCEVPEYTFLRKFSDARGFADCYVTEVDGAINQAAYVAAFYTSPLFKLERTVLAVVARKPASDADAQRLAEGKASSYSAWRVEAQSTTELLLADITGRTRSWLMARPVSDGVNASTSLYFGSAVVPHAAGAGATPRLGWPFHLLLGFHRLYSRMLLHAASKRVALR